MDNPADKIIKMNSENECGANELSDLLLFRFFKENAVLRAGCLRLPFAEPSLRRLIKKAYSTSLLAEEGRFPRFRIILGSNQDDLIPFASVVRFQSPVVINEANDLKRLAPAISEPNCALWVAEGGDEGDRRLECLGIIDADRFKKMTFIGTPDSRVGSDAVIDDTEVAIVKIEGPGSLRARFALQRGEFVLRGGQIRPTRSFAYLEVMIKLVKSVLAALSSQPSEPYAMDFLHSWAGVLEVANSKRHGAAFLLLPEQEITPKEIRDKYNFSDGFEVSLDLGKAFTEFLAACERYHQVKATVNQPGFEAVAHTQQMELLSNQWLASRRELFLMQDALAALSGVDGCVVLDRSLKAHLFGAKIQPLQDRTLLPLVDYDQSGTNLEAEMKSLGTRNNSAWRFCREYAGAFGFVLSQDSDLRLYCSDEKAAYAFLDLDTSI